MREGKYGIKICGIQDKATIGHCLDLDVRWLGFNFAKHSPRAIHKLPDAKNLLQYCPATKAVAIFQNQSAQEITHYMEELGIHYLQLSQPLVPIDDFLWLSEKYSVIISLPVAIINDIQKNNKRDEISTALIQRSHFILVDGAQPGSGKTWDVYQMHRFEELFSTQELSQSKFWLAGGLNAQNIQGISKTVASIFASTIQGFDCASGVEEKDSQGRIHKSNKKITEFVTAVRNLD